MIANSEVVKKILKGKKNSVLDFMEACRFVEFSPTVLVILFGNRKPQAGDRKKQVSMKEDGNLRALNRIRERKRRREDLLIEFPNKSRRKVNFINKILEEN